MLEESVGVRIRVVRKRSGLTQIEFARRVGSTASAVSTYENGRDPPVGLVERIWREFRVDLEWLIAGASSVEGRDG